MPREFTRNDLQNRETYAYIMQIQDEQARMEYLEDLKLSARNEKMLTEVKTRINDARQGLKHAQSGKYTLFPDAPFHPLCCGQWLCTDNGIYKETVDDNFALQQIRICPHPICPTARLVNIDSGTEHLRIDYKRDGRWRHIIIERSAVADKAQIVRNLSNKIEVTSETARDMVRFIADIIALNQDTIPAHKSADHLGWTTTDIGRLFIPYADTVTFDGEARFAHVFHAVREEGRFDLWRYTMRALRQHSKLFRVVLASSFASPLLELLDALPFVLHLWGGTGAGKTVAGMCAMSIWGDPGKGRLMWTLDSTKVFFGQAAAFLRNIPFYGDELQSVNDRYQSMDKLIMYLCEGIDRGRGAANGGVQATKQWANAFIFTGEQAVSSNASGGGVKNRLIEVQLKDGDVLVPDGNSVVSLITQNFGGAGKRYIDAVRKKDVSDLRQRYRDLQKELMQRSDTTDKQAYSMAAILLADEIACECIFEDEQPLRIEDVVQYMHSKKDVDVAGRAYDWTINWIARNPDRWNIESHGEHWGKMESGIATINRDVLTEALEGAGYPYSACIAAWGERGLIQRTAQGKNIHTASYGGVKASCVKLVLPSEKPQLPF